MEYELSKKKSLASDKAEQSRAQKCGNKSGISLNKIENKAKSDETPGI